MLILEDHGFAKLAMQLHHLESQYLRDQILKLQLLKPLPVSNVVYGLDISADGEYIVAGSDDYTVTLFNKDSSTPLCRATEDHEVRRTLQLFFH